MQWISLANTILVSVVTVIAVPLHADSLYKMDPSNPDQIQATVRAKIVEICRQLNNPRLDTNDKRMDEAKKISAAFPFRPDKVYIYSRRVKDVVLEAKIRIPFLYKTVVKDELFRPGGIGTPIKERTVYLYTIQVDYDAPADGSFDCGPGTPKSKTNGGQAPSLSRTINKAFAALKQGKPNLIETAAFPGIPRIAVTILNVPL